MTSWQNQPPMSRREAREAERRAAEALAERQPHPSGVVDFDPNGYGTQFVSDQEISVGDTTDIWQALQRRADEPQAPVRPASDELSRFRSGVPVAPQAVPTDSGALSGDLMDRVRGAVLRRDRDADDQARAISRREARQRETADLRDDGLPAGLFEPRAAAPEPSIAPAAYDPTRPGYYDEPYTPEPTVVVPVVQTGEHRVTVVDPQADDRIAFSSPSPAIAPAASHPAREPDLEFLEPRDPWAAVRAANSAPVRVAEPQPSTAVPTPRGAFGAVDVPTSTSAFGLAAVSEQSALQNPELGPPSEVTDLAGFEALIRKARAQQPGPQPAAAPAPAESRTFVWADEDEAQEGFTGLIGRGVQGGHGSSNALILPSDPQPDLMSAVNSTGDIFVTGSMRLSDRFAMTGAMHDHDDPEIDRLYEVAQEEPAAGVAPVRASKAISGSGQSGRIVTTRRRGNVLPTVLAVVAGAMAVGVVTLLIGSWVLKLF